MTDYQYDFPRHWWTYPETEVLILDEDMPTELLPEQHNHQEEERP